MASGEDGLASRVLYDFLACFLIILSHFSNYILHSGYTRLVPDILVLVLCLGIVALVLTGLLQIPSRLLRSLIYAILVTVIVGDVIFEYGTANFSGRLAALGVILLAAIAIIFFLRNHASTVLAVAFVAVLAATLVMGLFAPEKDVAKSAGPLEGESHEGPVILHLVLDEFAGLAAMSRHLPGGAEIRRDVEQFFLQAGFRAFENAYSQFFETSNSLAVALNFDDSGNPAQYLTKRRYGFSLDRNAYLQRAASDRYGIRIYQSDYFDLCSSASFPLGACTVYRPDRLSPMAIGGLTVGERLSFLFRMYYSSFAVIKLLKLAGQSGYGTFVLSEFWHGRVGPLAVVPVFERLKADIADAKPGTLFFAHLLMPHYPYVYTADCKVRTPVSSWRLRAGRENTSSTRLQRYADYFEQVRCTLRKLDALFETMKRAGLYENATIVIHGDHGSRINMEQPTATEAVDMPVNDFLDGYSTLFVLKRASVSPGVDRRALSLPQLLSFAATGNDDALSANRKKQLFAPGPGAGFVGVRIVPLQTRSD